MKVARYLRSSYFWQCSFGAVRPSNQRFCWFLLWCFPHFRELVSDAPVTGSDALVWGQDWFFNVLERYQEEVDEEMRVRRPCLKSAWIRRLQRWHSSCPSGLMPGRRNTSPLLGQDMKHKRQVFQMKQPVLTSLKLPRLRPRPKSSKQAKLLFHACY